ncbi:MAG TPA: c-type cytochrome, partial [Anaerolineae bacterium]|nr:c-type cytochrome [Anaerolineae bacterium]
LLLNEGLLDSQAATGTGRMQIEARAQKARSIEAGALIFISNCSTCHGDNGEGVPGKGLALNPDLFTKHYPAIQAARTFNGTLHDFIKATVASGRPVPSAYADSQGGFANPMPTWSQQFGGPLRDDQIEDVTNFILNWEAQAMAGPVLPPFNGIGADLTVPLPTGDAARGADLFAQKVKFESGSAAPCKACHSLQPNTVIVGPSLSDIGMMGATMVPGKAAADYIRESVQNPSAFIVPGNEKFVNNGKSLMPEGLGNNMSAQDLADLIAYLLTLK